MPSPTGLGSPPRRPFGCVPSPLPAPTEAGLSTLRLQPAPALLPSGPASLCHTWKPSLDHHTPASLKRGQIFKCSISPKAVHSLKLQSGPSA